MNVRMTSSEMSMLFTPGVCGYTVMPRKHTGKWDRHVLNKSGLLRCTKLLSRHNQKQRMNNNKQCFSILSRVSTSTSSGHLTGTRDAVSVPGVSKPTHVTHVQPCVGTNAQTTLEDIDNKPSIRQRGTGRNEKVKGRKGETERDREESAREKRE